ncbi:CG9812 [Drosophila busckii]|uniref:CG9812 n=1 Tax=Drosophila busckii TaxID=30019 RepID=A0A0M4EER1_DROBS|nr:CG9812 [Drosophila busckii]
MFAIYGTLCLLLVLQAQQTPAQLLTFRDGQVGVNFAGYHANAGLGGLLTGNAAHGGLSASAGTPWGSRAAAGLGGNLNGGPAGGAYAAAQANDEVGASAVLSGRVGEHGYAGSEAHAPGKQHGSTVHLTPEHVTEGVAAEPAAVVPTPRTTYVQKVRPPKKYALIAPNPAPKMAAKSLVRHKYAGVQTEGSVVAQHAVAKQAESPVGLALQIPIGILQSLQSSIGGLLGGQAAHHQPLGAAPPLHN